LFRKILIKPKQFLVNNTHSENIMFKKIIGISGLQLLALFGATAAVASDLSDCPSPICHHLGIQTSIGKIKSLFNSFDKTVQQELNQPTWWKKTVTQCDTRQCYKTELGLRLGFLQGVKDGVFITHEVNPFRSKYFPEIFTRCRKNFKGKPTLQYSEILFSFEPLGPTFYEINLTKSGVNASSWGWFDWTMSSSGAIVKSMLIPIQTMRRHNMELSWEFAEDMSKTGELELWNKYNFQEKGAFYGRYEFDANPVRQCITEHKNLI